MKTINITMSDDVYEIHIDRKGRRTWNQYAEDLANSG